MMELLITVMNSSYSRIVQSCTVLSVYLSVSKLLKIFSQLFVQSTIQFSSSLHHWLHFKNTIGCSLQIYSLGNPCRVVSSSISLCKCKLIKSILNHATIPSTLPQIVNSQKLQIMVGGLQGATDQVSENRDQLLTSDTDQA